MIQTLRLKGWKSHENSTLYFGKGSNLIIGPMGAGKTSALDAVCFALFGTFPALKSRRIKVEDIVMSRPERKEKAEVEMVFDASGKTYSVIRTINAKGGAEAVLLCDGKKLDANSVRVTEAIESMLGINYELFTRAIYSEQNRIDHFIVLGKGERKEQVDELLGIDRFETARAGTGSALNRLRETIENTSNFLQGIDSDGTEKQAALLFEEITTMKSKAQNDEKVFSELLKKKSEKENIAKMLENDEKKFREAEKRLEGLKYTLIEKERETEARKKSVKIVLDKAEVEKTGAKVNAEIGILKQSRKELQQARIDFERAKSQLGFIQAELKKHGGVERKKTLDKITELETLLSQQKGDSKRLQEQVNDTLAKAKEAENALAVLAKEAASCPVCESPLSKDKHAELKKQKHAALEEEKNKASGFREELKKLEAIEEKASSELSAQKILLTQAERSETLSHEEKKAVKELEDKTSALHELEKNFSEEKLQQAEEKLSEIGKLKEIVQAEEKIRLLKAEASEVEKQLRAIVFDDAGLKQVRKELLDVERDTSALRTGISAVKARFQDKEKILVELERKKELVQKKRQESIQVEDKLKRLTVFQNALVDAQASLRTELIDAVNGAMAALWPSIYPYNDYRGIRIKADHDGYALELQTLENTWIGVENASGGEKSCASLALRVAFSMVLAPNLSWLVLDEPTHNLDRQAVVLLCNALREEIPKIVEQTFIITHDEALREGASARVYRVDRDKDKGDRSVIEELGYD